VPFRKTLSLLTPDYNVSKDPNRIAQNTQPSPLEQNAAEQYTGK